jgi:hypothetical protein
MESGSIGQSQQIYLGMNEDRISISKNWILEQVR